MTHAGHRAYKKVDQKNRPCDLRDTVFKERNRLSFRITFGGNILIVVFL